MKIGDLVRVKKFPFTHHTAKIIDRKRCFLGKRWVAELDKSGFLGHQFVKGIDRNFIPIDENGQVTSPVESNKIEYCLLGFLILFLFIVT